MTIKTTSFALAEVKSATTDDPNGAFEAVLSAPTLDRDGEVIDAGAFDPLPSRITIDMDHGLSMATTVGSGTPYYDGDVLKISGTFASIPRAQEARALVAEGHISTMSVAFMGAQKTKAKDGPSHVTKAELLNAAFVAVPSNRDALVLSAKAMNDKAGARNSKADAQMIQAVHDHAAALGADCSGAKSIGRRVDTKTTVAGSYEDRQEDIQEALVEANTGAIRAAYPNADPGEYGWLIHIVATFDDRVVYQIGWDDDDAWQVTYTWDGEEVTLAGNPEHVTVDQVVTVSPDDETTRSVKPEDAAAKAAAISPAEAEAEAEFHIWARAISLVAFAAAAAV